MPCNCQKRKIVQQTVKKAPPRPTTQRVTSGKRIIHKVIR